MAVVVDIGDDRLLRPRARADLCLGEEDPVTPPEDAEESLVSIDDLDLTVAIEIERHRARRVRAVVADRALPTDRAVAIEQIVVDGRSDTDLWDTVGVDVGDERRSGLTSGRRRSAETSAWNGKRRVRRRVPDLGVGPVVIQHEDLSVGDDDDFGEGIVVEIADRHVTVWAVVSLPDFHQLAI